MKSIFIYYSISGNGDLVSKKLEEKGIVVRKVQPKKELPKRFFFRIMTGGFLAGLNIKDKLINFDNDVSEYDHIIIGSPIWNGRLSTPINTVLNKVDFTNKKVTFILYSGSGKGPKAMKKINKLFNNPRIIVLQVPLKYLNELDKINL